MTIFVFTFRENNNINKLDKDFLQKGNSWRPPEFLGLLIASLLVAQWWEHWCVSLVAQVWLLACLIQSQLLQGETWSCCCHLQRFCKLHFCAHAYMLTHLQDSWLLRGLNLWPIGQSVLIKSYRRARISYRKTIVLIGSYKRVIVGGTPEFLGHLVSSLLVAQWLERWRVA